MPADQFQEKLIETQNDLRFIIASVHSFASEVGKFQLCFAFERDTL